MDRVLRRLISVLSWAAIVVLALFGIYFSFANYPAFGIAATLAIGTLIAWSERNRRQRQRTAERVRRLRRERLN
jgi:NhaP-type Na+/H+ or K+/H+ antiporter